MFHKTILTLALLTAFETSFSNAYSQDSTLIADITDIKQDSQEYRKEVRQDQSDIASDRTNIKSEDKMLGNEEQKLSQLKSQQSNDLEKLKADKASGNKAAIIADEHQLQEDRSALKKAYRDRDSTRGSERYYENQKKRNSADLKKDNMSKGEASNNKQDSQEYRKEVRQDQSDIASDRTNIKSEDKMLGNEEQKLSQLKSQQSNDLEKLKADKASGNKAAIIADEHQLQEDRSALKKAYRDRDSTRGSERYYENQKKRNSADLKKDITN